MYIKIAIISNSVAKPTKICLFQPNRFLSVYHHNYAMVVMYELDVEGENVQFWKTILNFLYKVLWWVIWLYKSTVTPVLRSSN